MTKRSKKQKFQNESGEALKSLLNDQVEARLKREISLSHGQQASVLKEDSIIARKNDQKKIHDEKSLKSRNMPDSKETKAQLTERIRFLLDEIELLEKDYYYLQAKFEESMHIQNDYSSKLKDLENKIEEMEEELRSKPNLISQYQSRELELKTITEELRWEREQLQKKLAAFQSKLEEKNQETDQLSSSLEDGRTEVGRLKKELNIINQEKNELIINNKHLKQVLMEKEKFLAQMEKPEETEKRVTAKDWKAKADTLWDGVSYSAPRQAITYLTSALELDPENAQLYNERGLAHIDEYQIKEAVEDLTTAIALRPDFAEAYHNRGVVLIKDGKMYAAKKDFQMAARLGLWMGVNYLQSTAKSPGIVRKLLMAFGKDRRGE